MTDTKDKLREELVNELKTTPALISAGDLTEKFTEIIETIDTIEQQSKMVKVTSDEELVIAENQYANIGEVLKRLDNKRALIKAPYFNTGKVIDSYARMIREKLESAKKRYNTNITSYKSIQRAAAIAKAEAEEKKQKELEAKKKAQLDNINRIYEMVIAKLYGGSYSAKNGERKQADGCKTKEECIALLQGVQENFKPENFDYHVEYAEDVFNKMIITISEAAQKIVAGKNKAEEEIQQAKEKAREEAEEQRKKQEKVIEKESRTALKEVKEEVKEAGRGLRATLRYNIVNSDKLDREFLSPDPKKIANYMAMHRDKIKEEIKEGKQRVDGLEFYMAETNVSN